MADDAGEEPLLDPVRHLKYWKMCLRSPLPHVYLSNETNRMALAYFIINSITLLTPLEPTPESPPPLLSPEERRELRAWVLSHQHPTGGFCGTSSLVFPLQKLDNWDFSTHAPGPERTGSASIAATLFALQLLALLSDDHDEPEGGVFSGVDRVQTLRWLRRLQREDGSFGEHLTELPADGWFIAGGYDMRWCYIASEIRWMLRGDVGKEEGDPNWVEDFDTAKLAQYILNSQTYDGGFAGSSKEEPHAGYAYCAISALTLLDRPLESESSSSSTQQQQQQQQQQPPPQDHNQTPPPLLSRIRDTPGLIHWLASRQFVYLDPPPPPPANKEEDAQEEYDSDEEDPNTVNFYQPPLETTPQISRRLVAFNGRANKTADTCYAFWSGASLVSLLGPQTPTASADGGWNWRPAARRFLLEKMQHRSGMGGFGKTPGAPPDLYHGFFGLAALAVMGDPRDMKVIRPMDSSLALPMDAVRRVERGRAALLRRRGEGKGAGGGGGIDLGLALLKGGEKRPSWLLQTAKPETTVA